MSQTHEFTFTQCISEQNFKSKPTDTECQSIVFRPRQVTVKGLLDYATHGGVFSPTCRSNKPDGSFHITTKKRKNFESSHTVFFDFDKMDQPLDDFVKTLKYLPTFGYTSYRNGMDGYRFRVGYVFHYPLKGVQNYDAMYHAIVRANQFKYETETTGGLDKRCTAISCYFGTTPHADIYTSNYTYLYDDFEAFVEPEKDTATSTVLASENYNADTTINADFLADFNTLGTEAFLKKYYDQYHRNYLASLSSPLILDQSQMFYTYPNGYLEVKHRRKGKMTLKWDIGSNRKNRLFIAAQIMLYNVPDLTIENLLYNLRLERDWYYVNTDGKVNNRYLVQTCCRSMVKRYPLHPSWHHAFAVNKRFWREQGVSMQAASNHIRAYLRAQRIRELINPYVSVEQNFEVLKENGVKICLKTLKRMVTRGDIQIYKTRSLPTVLSDCRKDVTNPVTNEILNLIKADGAIKQSTIAEMFELDIRTVKRYFKDMNGTLIRREGNNRTGRWVVIEPSGEDSQK